MGSLVSKIIDSNRFVTKFEKKRYQPSHDSRRYGIDTLISLLLYDSTEKTLITHFNHHLHSKHTSVRGTMVAQENKKLLIEIKQK